MPAHPPMISTQGAEQGKKLNQYLYTLAATLVVFSGGTVLAWSSPALPFLTSSNSSFVLTPNQGSWAGSLVTVGAVAGALPAGAAADMIGRKMMVHLSGVPLLISWVMVTLANSVSMLYIARLIAGVGLGAICACTPLYIAEIAENSVRGTLSFYFQLQLVTGILYTYVVGAFFTYKVFCILCTVIPAIFLVVFFIAPETPFYLLKKQKREEALKSLRKVRGEEYNVYKEVNYWQNSIDRNSRRKTDFVKAVTSDASFKALIISMGLMVFQQLSGINVVIFYSASIFKDAGSSLEPSIATIIVGATQIVATYASSTVVDKAGRKLLLIVSAIVMALCL